MTIGYDAARTPVSRTYTRTSDGTMVAFDRGTLNQRGQWISRYSNGRSMSYRYDSIGRLVGVDDSSDWTQRCTRRAYAYDAHSNRISAGETTNYAGDPCPDVPITSAGSTYDTADRLLTTPGSNGSAWTYDPFGRTTLMPTTDGEATVANAFYVNDQVASQTQAGSSRISWTLDPIQRRSTSRSEQWVNCAWANPVTTVSHYATDSDEPAWINEDATQPAAVTRYVSGVDGDIAATTSTTGNRVAQLIDLHGDVMATVPIADAATQATWTALRFTAFDEFGRPLDMASGTGITGPPLRYGWLGADQRSTQALGGVILMGQRLYLPTIGRFLSVDPVPGGSANAYDYCNADPVNCTDLNGTFAWKKLAGIVAAVASVASIIPGPIGMAAAGISAVAYYAAGDKKQALIAAAGIALAAVGAGVAVVAVKTTQRIEQASQLARSMESVAKTLQTGEYAGFKSGRAFTSKADAAFRAGKVGTKCAVDGCHVLMTASKVSRKGVPKDMKQIELDHIFPRSKGGNNSPFNRRAICAMHNNLKGAC